MAHERITLLDIAKANSADSTVGLIEEAIQDHPELMVGDARTIPGIGYETLVRTGYPASGSFRTANEGVEATKSVFENRKVETYTLNRYWEADKAVADRYVDGPAAYIAMEAVGEMEAAMIDLGSQFYYGNNAVNAFAANVKGYPGLMDVYDATNMVVDAGGTTDDKGSSVWFVEFGPKAVRWVWGRNGQLDPSDVEVETITDANGKKYKAYTQDILAYPGLQVGSIKSLVRIKKLTEDSGKTLTDDLIFEALSKFPAGRRPTHCFMSRRSNFQLQTSRVATNPTGAPAPLPTAITGLPGAPIPILVTDAIRDDEKLAW